MSKTYKTQLAKNHNKIFFLIGTLALLAIIAITLKLTILETPQSGAEVGNTGSQNTKGEASLPNGNAHDKAADGQTAIQPGDQKSDSGSNPPARITLLTPSGNFISNHAPDQSHPTETSVCTTAPGASCSITFTKNGLTKALSVQTTDRGGTTYWNNWSPTDIGLTSGSWQVQAVATLNGQTQTAQDAIPLVITQ